MEHDKVSYKKGGANLTRNLLQDQYSYIESALRNINDDYSKLKNIDYDYSQLKNRIRYINRMYQSYLTLESHLNEVNSDNIETYYLLNIIFLRRVHRRYFEKLHQKLWSVNEKIRKQIDSLKNKDLAEYDSNNQLILPKQPPKKTSQNQDNPYRIDLSQFDLNIDPENNIKLTSKENMALKLINIVNALTYMANFTLNLINLAVTVVNVAYNAFSVALNTLIFLPNMVPHTANLAIRIKNNTSGIKQSLNYLNPVKLVKLFYSYEVSDIENTNNSARQPNDDSEYYDHIPYIPLFKQLIPRIKFRLSPYPSINGYRQQILDNKSAYAHQQNSSWLVEIPNAIQTCLDYLTHWCLNTDTEHQNLDKVDDTINDLNRNHKSSLKNLQKAIVTHAQLADIPLQNQAGGSVSIPIDTKESGQNELQTVKQLAENFRQNYEQSETVQSDELKTDLDRTYNISGELHKLTEATLWLTNNIDQLSYYKTSTNADDRKISDFDIDVNINLLQHSLKEIERYSDHLTGEKVHNVYQYCRDLAGFLKHWQSIKQLISQTKDQKTIAPLINNHQTDNLVTHYAGLTQHKDIQVSDFYDKLVNNDYTINYAHNIATSVQELEQTLSNATDLTNVDVGTYQENYRRLTENMSELLAHDRYHTYGLCSGMDKYEKLYEMLPKIQWLKQQTTYDQHNRMAAITEALNDDKLQLPAYIDPQDGPIDFETINEQCKSFLRDYQDRYGLQTLEDTTHKADQCIRGTNQLKSLYEQFTNQVDESNSNLLQQLLTTPYEQDTTHKDIFNELQIDQFDEGAGSVFKQANDLRSKMKEYQRKFDEAHTTHDFNEVCAQLYQDLHDLQQNVQANLNNNASYKINKFKEDVAYLWETVNIYNSHKAIDTLKNIRYNWLRNYGVNTDQLQKLIKGRIPHHPGDNNGWYDISEYTNAFQFHTSFRHFIRFNLAKDKLFDRQNGRIRQKIEQWLQDCDKNPTRIQNLYDKACGIYRHLGDEPIELPKDPQSLYNDMFHFAFTKVLIKRLTDDKYQHSLKQAGILPEHCQMLMNIRDDLYEQLSQKSDQEKEQAKTNYKSSLKRVASLPGRDDYTDTTELNLIRNHQQWSQFDASYNIEELRFSHEIYNRSEQAKEALVNYCRLNQHDHPTKAGKLYKMLDELSNECKKQPYNLFHIHSRVNDLVDKLPNEHNDVSETNQGTYWSYLYHLFTNNKLAYGDLNSFIHDLTNSFIQYTNDYDVDTLNKYEETIKQRLLTMEDRNPETLFDPNSYEWDLLLALSMHGPNDEASKKLQPIRQNVHNKQNYERKNSRLQNEVISKAENEKAFECMGLAQNPFTIQYSSNRQTWNNKKKKWRRQFLDAEKDVTTEHNKTATFNKQDQTST